MTRKMLVVTLAKTSAVLAAASRRASGVPAVAELVGEGLLARVTGSEESLAVPAGELEVKEVDHSDEVFRTPRAHVVDSSGTIVVSTNLVSGIAAGGLNVTVTMSPPPAAADKSVVLIIDAGPNAAPLKFVGKTVLNTATAAIPVSGVPPGAHLVLASVDGYNARLEVESF